MLHKNKAYEICCYSKSRMPCSVFHGLSTARLSTYCQKDDYIYLAYESQVGYHYSNSNELFLEVALSRGLLLTDFQRKDEEYCTFLKYHQTYVNLYYSDK